MVDSLLVQFCYLRTCFASLAVVTLMFAGCGTKDADRVAVHPVSGAIQFHGQPAVGAFVALHPKNGGSTGAPNPRAMVGPDVSKKSLPSSIRPPGLTPLPRIAGFTLLLPYVEEDTKYDLYDQTKNWFDSTINAHNAKNKEVVNTTISILQCGKLALGARYGGSDRLLANDLRRSSLVRRRFCGCRGDRHDSAG
jgi:hypothetical protein